MYRLRQYIVILFLLIFISNLKASSPYVFRSFDVSNGLPENTVKCITQDDQGFIWLGTFNGLCRFDGVEFQTFTHNVNDSTSIANNTIYALCPQKDGIWVGTDKGFDFFSLENNCFYRGTLQTDTSNMVPWKHRVQNIISVNGRIFMQDHSGNLYIHYSGLQFKSCKYELGRYHSVTPYKGNLLAHTTKGIYLIDVTTGKIVTHYNQKRNRPSEVIYFSENQHKVYIGYGMNKPTEVYKIDVENGIEKIEETQTLSDVDRIIDWGDKVIFGTNGKGLVEYSEHTINFCTTMNSTISSDVITCLFVDHDNNLWAGTYRDGLNLCSNSFGWFKSLTIDNANLTHKLVTAVISRKELLFIGLDGGGLNVYNSSTGKLEVYNTSNSAIRDDHILSVADDGQYIWLGTYMGGLCSFLPENRTFKTYPFPSGYIWSIKDDGKGHIWVAGKDVHIYDKQTGKYKLVDGLSNVWASDIVFDKGLVWISTSGTGIYKLDEEKKIILAHYHETSTEYPISGNNIPYLYMDSKHTIWFSVHNSGLCRLNENNKTVITYGKTSGLTASNVTAILEDSSGCLWVGTDNGLFRFHPHTETFIRFSKNDYLPSIQINHNACFKEDDKMYFGTTNGLIYLNPTEINYDKCLKPIYFRTIKLLKNDSIIHINGKNLPETINLTHKQNFFTVSFSLPELVFPDKMRFSCRMEGFEEGWRDIENARQVSYTNIPPGKYVFTIRTLDWNGQWSKETASLNICITPPWWRTYWAIGLWICLLVSILYLIYRFYRYQDNIKKIAREEEMEKNMVKKDNEIKLRFFTNISHEFRTPLSLIISPLELLIKNESDSVYRDKLSRIHKNAQNLLNLVNQLLDFRKLEIHGEKLSSSFGDLVEFVETISQVFQENADSEQKELIFLPKVEHLYMSFDKDKIRKILNNLLSNAFKFTTVGAQITIVLEKQEEDGQEYAVIRVRDTGYGIQADKLPHVFECFYQEERNLSTNTGSGIGLHIVKEYVTLHNGKVKVESVVNQGTTFAIYLPIMPQQTDVTIELQSEKADVTFESVPETDSSRKKLLIVEDNEEFRHFLVEQLETDYCVVQASNGEEGEQAALKELPDVIITDIMMPRVDGVELCKRIKSNIQVSHIPVILLTARASHESMLNGYEAGADEYISKPFDFDILQMKIRKLIFQQNERKARFEHAIEIKPVDITITSLDEKMIQDALQAIEKNLSNTDYSIDNLSNEIGMSRTNLYKKIQAVTGKTPASFIRAIRLKKAAQLLRNSDLNISEISDCIGFGNIKYFNKHFKEEFKMTPSQYRDSVTI